MAEQADEQRLGSQPIVVLSDESERTQGRDAQAMNISAGKAVAESVRTTLGPKGMDKMLVDSMGDVVVTNDGVTILDEMDIEHPTADMVVEVAQSQEDETGDGTTTAVVVAGELLEEAERLLEQDVHPQTIVRGYLDAAKHAQQFLREHAIDVDVDDTDTIEAVARTAMTGKLPAGGEDLLVELAVRAAQTVTIGDDVDLDYLDIETVPGGAVGDSQLIDGVLVDKDPVHENMPKAIEDARIALLDTAIEVEDAETDIEANVTDPDQLEAFLEQEEQQLRELVEAITSVGANVVFCGKGIDDMAQHFLAEAGVLAVRRAKSSDLDQLARATDGSIVSNIEDLEEAHLGRAGRVIQRELGDDEQLFVEECEAPNSATLVVRGGTEHVVEGAERALEDALDAVALVLEDHRILPGGGAPEAALALELREYAEGFEGREQLAVEAFADALEAVPRTLAQTGGLDPIDALVELRSQQAEGEFHAGLDGESGDVIDMVESGVVEPLAVKTNAIASAQEAANLIVRIDDVIAGGGGDEEEEGPPGAGGPPGGMGGGMPGGGMPDL